MEPQKSEAGDDRLKHYGTLRLAEVFHHVRDALRPADLDHEVGFRIGRLQRDEQRIRELLGRDVVDLRTLIVGPGQLLREARYFGLRNQVTTFDIDEIPQGFAPSVYFRMLRRNGFARFAKTLGRKVLRVDQRELAAWRRSLKVDKLPGPTLIIRDVCDGLPSDMEAFDVAMSWAVFQTIPDPAAALEGMIETLRPGGVLYVGIHQWTSETGHHDARAFTHQAESIPLWAHLRPSTQHLVSSSAYLNRWRLDQWRDLFNEKAPGHSEFLERYGESELRARLSPDIRDELSDYRDEELFTTEVFFAWRKPAGP